MTKFSSKKINHLCLSKRRKLIDQSILQKLVLRASHLRPKENPQKPKWRSWTGKRKMNKFISKPFSRQTKVQIFLRIGEIIVIYQRMIDQLVLGLSWSRKSPSSRLLPLREARGKCSQLKGLGQIMDRFKKLLFLQQSPQLDKHQYQPNHLSQQNHRLLAI